MEKKTVVDQVEIKRDGTMQIRFRKLLVDDDGTETELGYHRTAVMPGDDVAAQLEAVDTHLKSKDMKAGGLGQEEKDFVQQVEAAMWTPEVIEAKQEQIRAQAEKMAAEAIPEPVTNPKA